MYRNIWRFPYSFIEVSSVAIKLQYHLTEVNNAAAGRAQKKDNHSSFPSTIPWLCKVIFKERWYWEPQSSSPTVAFLYVCVWWEGSNSIKIYFKYVAVTIITVLSLKAVRLSLQVAIKDVAAIAISYSAPGSSASMRLSSFLSRRRLQGRRNDNGSVARCPYRFSQLATVWLYYLREELYTWDILLSRKVTPLAPDTFVWKSFGAHIFYLNQCNLFLFWHD